VRRQAQRDRHELEIAASRPVRLRQQATRNIFRMDDGNRLCHRGNGQFRNRPDPQSRAGCRGPKHALTAPSRSADRILDRRCLGLSSFNRLAWLLLCFFLFGALGSACAGPKPILLEGDANSAQVGYYGEIDDATLVAKQHCAKYERVPRFLDAAEDVAFFDCVLP
jgi:hypothetical protein